MSDPQGNISLMMGFLVEVPWKQNTVKTAVGSDTLTIGIPDLTLILESSCNSNAKNHQDPINIWNVYLSKKLF